MKEDHFLPLPAQGNIYSTTRLGNAILFGAGKHGRIMAYLNRTSLDEVILSSLPVGVDVVAVDAIEENFPVLGVTYVQTAHSGIEDIKTGYFNIYTNWAPHGGQEGSSPISSTSSGSRSSSSSSPGQVQSPKHIPKLDYKLSQLEQIGQRCISFKLAYIPYHLYHVPVVKANGSYGIIYLLSGSDRRVHAYEPNEESKTFAEVPVQKYFPEIEGRFPSVVTRLQIECIPGLRKRITLCGCEDGTLKAFIVSEWYDSASPVFSSERASPINITKSSSEAEPKSSEKETPTDAASESGDTASLISSMNEDLDLGQSIQRYTHQFDGMITCIRFYTDGFSVNAVVSSANSPVYVYTNTLEDRFQSGHALKFSSRWDCVEAVCVADLDFDGINEIVIGTFGCTLLVYKFMDDIQRWVIVANQKLPSAIFSIEFYDYYLHVVSGVGLHIIEYSMGAYFLQHGMVPTSTAMEELTRQVATGLKLSDSTKVGEGDEY